MTIRWLRCQVQNGMFQNERSIKFNRMDGRIVSAFVPASDVREDAGKWSVRVRFVSASDGCWVLLPEDTCPFAVPEADLVG